MKYTALLNFFSTSDFEHLSWIILHLHDKKTLYLEFIWKNNFKVSLSLDTPVFL